MITVHELVEKFCKDENLPLPDKKTLMRIGSLCNQYFREISAKAYEPGSVVQNAGFKCVVINGEKMVVVGYPALMAARFIGIINQLMYNCGRKAEKQASRADQAPAGQDTRKTEERPVKRKRKPIPGVTMPVIKVFSSKTDLK